mmetsp:Transcript_9711/g.14928  ORF Transcript_9711/g.14928 Transcript_9711/m.14928 type:complete len:336 (-) Transcript_9711:299-1306(-)
MHFLMHFFLLYDALYMCETSQSLDCIEQNVTLFDHLGILCVLGISPPGLHHPCHLVDLCVQSSRGDEAAKLPVQEIRANSKGGRHGGQPHTLVGLEELGVGQDAQLAHNVAPVLGQHAVPPNHTMHLHQRLEEPPVITVVERVHQVPHRRHFPDHSKDFRSVYNLFLDGGPLLGEQRGDGSVLHKQLVAAHLQGRERGQAVQQQIRSLLQVPGGHVVEGLVDLEAVAAVPVAPRLVQARALLQVALQGRQVHVEKSHPSPGHLGIQLLAGTDLGHGEDGVVGGVGLLLVPRPRPQLGHRKQGIQHLCFSLVLLSIFLLLFQLFCLGCRRIRQPLD